MSLALTAKQLLVFMEQASGYLWIVPETPSVSIALQPLGLASGKWAVVKHGGGDDRTVWTAEGWVTAQRPTEDIYCWQLPDALRQVEPLVKQHGADHTAWLAARTATTIEDEFLAEFAVEVA